MNITSTALLPTLLFVVLKFDYPRYINQNNDHKIQFKYASMI
jgi:hypothetical protein